MSYAESPIRNVAINYGLQPLNHSALDRAFNSIVQLFEGPIIDTCTVK